MRCLPPFGGCAGAVRRLCDHDLCERLELSIHGNRSDPAAVAEAGVLAVPCLVGCPPAPPAPDDDLAGRLALHHRIEHLEATLEAITSGAADALLLGGNDPAGTGARFFVPDGADQP